MIIVGPRTQDSAAGYHIVTPLVRSDGTTVLVNRGFVSKDGFEKLSKADEEIFVQTMLRVSQVRSSFTPDSHLKKGGWYWIIVGAMAEHAGAVDSVPIVRQSRIAFVPTHPSTR